MKAGWIAQYFDTESNRPRVKLYKTKVEALQFAQEFGWEGYYGGAMASYEDMLRDGDIKEIPTDRDIWDEYVNDIVDKDFECIGWLNIREISYE